jgi:uncharacterized protein YciI
MLCCMHFLLIYDVVDNYLEARAPFRGQHLKLAQESFDRGELILGGAFAEPVDGAILVFRGPTAAAAENFAKNDPYVLNGAVKAWRVRQWATVIGDGLVPPQL